MEKKEGEGGGSSLGDVSIFEVFKVGVIPKTSITKGIPIEQIQKNFTLLVPVNTVDQILDPNVTMLATLPKAGHMIVDESKFKSMVSQKIAKELDIKLREMKAQGDSRFFVAEEVFP